MQCVSAFLLQHLRAKRSGVNCSASQFPKPGEGLASLRSGAGPAWPDLGIRLTRGDDGQPCSNGANSASAWSNSTRLAAVIAVAALRTDQDDRAALFGHDTVVGRP